MYTEAQYFIRLDFTRECLFPGAAVRRMISCFFNQLFTSEGEFRNWLKALTMWCRVDQV